MARLIVTLITGTIFPSALGTVLLEVLLVFLISAVIWGHRGFAIWYVTKLLKQQGCKRRTNAIHLQRADYTYLQPRHTRILMKAFNESFLRPVFLKKQQFKKEIKLWCCRVAAFCPNRRWSLLRNFRFRAKQNFRPLSTQQPNYIDLNDPPGPSRLTW